MARGYPGHPPVPTPWRITAWGPRSRGPGRAAMESERETLERAQPRGEVALEQLHEAPLVVAGRVEHEVVHAPVDVLLDLLDHLVGIVADDPPRGDLLDGQRIRRLLHLDRIGDVVLLLLAERERRPEAGVLEGGVVVGVVRDLDLEHAIDVVGC